MPARAGPQIRGNQKRAERQLETAVEGAQLDCGEVALQRQPHRRHRPERGDEKGQTKGDEAEAAEPEGDASEHGVCAWSMSDASVCASNRREHGHCLAPSQGSWVAIA